MDREAQIIRYMDGVFHSLGRQRTMIPSVVSDGLRIRATLVQRGGQGPQPHKRQVFDGSLPLSNGRSRDVRTVQQDAHGFKELVYVMWLAWKRHLEMRAEGLQEELTFRPGDVLKASVHWKT